MQITSMHVDITPSMKALIEEKFAHIQGHFHSIDQEKCHIIYHESYRLFEVELTVHLDHEQFFTKKSNATFAIALQEATQAVLHSLEKHKTKLSAKHQNHHHNEPM